MYIKSDVFPEFSEDSHQFLLMHLKYFEGF